MTAKKTTAVTTKIVNSDSLTWANPLGGAWGTAGNWYDTKTSANATVAPTAGNSVIITGATANGVYNNITGNGIAANLTAFNNVLLWGTVAVSGAVLVGQGANAGNFQYGDLELDGGASLSASYLSVANYSFLEVTGGSTLADSGVAQLGSGPGILNGTQQIPSFVAATAGSTVRFGSLLADNAEIAVDDNSSVEIGNAGGAALGAITVDKGQTAIAGGTLDGNVVVNGVLAIEAGATLAVDTYDPFGVASAISGSGTLQVGEGSDLTLGVADSAAIQFTAPNGTLHISVLPTGIVSGFAVGDVLELAPGLATGVSFKQTSTSAATLTFTKGGKSVGAVTLAGNYTGDLFHLSPGGNGNAWVSLQIPGNAPTQPGVITGTAGADYLSATANNQTLTGLGGGDTENASGFTGIDFKDTSGNLNGTAIVNFGTTDIVDLTDMKLSSAKVSTS